MDLNTALFPHKEEKEIQKAQFRSKAKTILSLAFSMEFNGTRLSMRHDKLIMKQKKQGSKLTIMNIKDANYAQQYLQQLARNVYISSICQLEAMFDLSTAAQAKQLNKNDSVLLNKPIKWQMKNLQQGLRYIPIDLTTAKLMIFADGSFANNKDMSSQLRFVLTIINEDCYNNTTFTIKGNVLYWSSTKCKRVIRNVLASEIYGMVNRVDIGDALLAMLRQITDQLKLPPILFIVCTDLYALYKCFVKLGSTKKKRFMIDIMAL